MEKKIKDKKDPKAVKTESAKTEKTETLFTYTGRHFNSYPINFQKIENYCPES